MSRATSGLVTTMGAAHSTSNPGPRRHHRGGMPPGLPHSTSLTARAVPVPPPTLLETRLRPPQPGTHLIQRRELVERVNAAEAAVVTVCAPPGYGKTTFASQLAAAADRPVAWLSLDEADHDPTRLLIGLAASLNRCLQLDPWLLQALRSATPSVFAEVLPRLVNGLARDGCLLILDDVQHVTASPSAEVLGYLCEHVPPEMRVVLAGRRLSGLPVGRLRARRMLLELGPDALALDREQTRELVDGVGVYLTPEACAALHAQTEGWPAATYLAALAARHADDPDGAIRAFGGADPTLVDFLTTEQLNAESNEHLAFLLRTSVLDRLSAPLCDAVLGRDDSAAILAAMEQSNGFVIALDRRRQWYRYHHLFSQALQSELTHREPAQPHQLHRRASCWFEAHDNIAEAVEHAIKARDERRVADLLAEHIEVLLVETSPAKLCRWLETLPDSVLLAHPPVLAAGAWAMFQLGDLENTRRCMRLLEGLSFDGPGPLGEVSGQAAVALLRAIVAWDGASRITRHADAVRDVEPRVSRAFRTAGLCLGISLFLQGRCAAARDLLEDAAEVAGCPVEIPALAYVLLALLDLEEHCPRDAEVHIRSAYAALEAAERQAGLVAAPLAAALAWLDIVRKDRAAARVNFDRAVGLLPRAAVVPWLSIYVRIVLGRVALELDDVESAGGLLGAARRGLVRHPDAGVLPHMLASADRARQAAQGGSHALLAPLTQAELRVLALAPTCLSIEEIGRTLCVSKNTVKTHLKVIYAKLTVASRGEAVERARALRLIA
ncbi:MAG: hypothetical protein JO352_19325 [Chloroflexi bacterium]|nr:hypothetical protein [Chloroflexota bacterium]